MDQGTVSVRFDRGTLILRGVSQRQIAEISAPGVWTWDGRVSAWRCEAIHYADLCARFRAKPGATFQDNVPPFPEVCWPKCELPELRSEQRAALAAWNASGCRGQVIMPTGTGKTEVALAAMAGARVSTLIVAPVRDLMHQWHQRILRRLGYDAGIVGDSLFNIRPVTVTTYDSAYIHSGEMGARFGLIIFDEAHHLPGKCYREAALMSAAPKRLALTATPERSDGLHVDLDRLVGPVVYRQEIADARGRTLAEYNVVRIPVTLSPEEQYRYDKASRSVRVFIAERRKTQPHYSWEDLCAESGKDPEARKVQREYFAKKAIEDRAAEKLRALEDLFRLHSGERVIVFAGSNAMAIDVSRRFLVPTLLSHSRKNERRAVLEGFAAGSFPAIVANQVLDEGVDVPEAKVAVVIGGQASTRQAKQRLGRILRQSRGLRAVLYEVVCEETKDVERSRERRRSDAYERTVHHRF